MLLLYMNYTANDKTNNIDKETLSHRMLNLNLILKIIQESKVKSTHKLENFTSEFSF